MAAERLVDLTIDTTATAAGVATLRIAGPGDSFDVFVVELISLRSTSAALPACTLYRGDPADGRQLSFNPDGQAGTFVGGGAADRIGSGDVWSLQWTGADPGSFCSASVTGIIRRRS